MSCDNNFTQELKVVAMIRKNQFLRNVSAAGLSLLCVKAATLFKISFIVGSSMAFFSGSSIAMPLVGALGGIMCSVMTFGLGCLVRGLTGSLFSAHYLAYHIPGLCGAAYFSGGVLIRLLLPISCMIAFIAHPTGSQAFLYTTYWLIPIVLYFVRHSSFFLHALASTFIAHAVGSVIWIYTVPMVWQDWMALMPVVAFERLLCATGMFVAYKIFNYSYDFIFSTHGSKITRSLKA